MDVLVTFKINVDMKNAPIGSKIQSFLGKCTYSKALLFDPKSTCSLSNSTHLLSHIQMNSHPLNSYFLKNGFSNYFPFISNIYQKLN